MKILILKMFKLEKIKLKCWKIFFKNENYKNKNNIINKITNNYNKNNNITKFDLKNLGNDNIKIEDEEIFEEEKQTINIELNEILDNDEEESP